VLLRSVGYSVVGMLGDPLISMGINPRSRGAVSGLH
jgi:hypothetical protein